MVGDLPKSVQPTEEADGAKLPSERFGSAGEVREVCQAMIKADRLRAAERARIDGLVAGNRPYSQAMLRGKGQGWRSNVNFLESEGILQAQQTPFFDLVTSVPNVIEVDCDYGKGQDQRDWEESIDRNFTWLMLNRWRKGFNFHIPYQQLCMLKHGLGFHVRPTLNKWIPRTPRPGQVLFPEDCPLNFDEDGEYFMLRDFVPAHVLYGYIRNEGAAAKLGWKIKTTWLAMRDASKKKPSSDDLEAFQSEMRRGDIGAANTRQSGLTLNYLFVKEFEGKISLYVIAEDNPQTGYLFTKRNLFSEWPINIFPYDIGDGTIHSIRGLGERTKAFFELSNRIKNAMADNVLISMYPQFKQLQGVDPDKLKLMRVGAMSIYPQGIEPQIMNFPPLNNSGIALSRELDSTLSKNNQTYMGGAPEPKDRETAQSFMTRAQDSAQVSNGAHSLYGSVLREFYEQTLRMVIKDTPGDSMSAVMAREFRERCKKDGVPPEALNRIVEVRECLSTGAGSAAARLQALMMGMQYLYGPTTEDRKINMERDLAAAIFSSAKVDRYARSSKDNDLPNTDDSFAVQENNGMAQGGDAVVSATQDHVAHAGAHLQKATEVVQAVSEGQMDAAQGLAIIQKIGQHVAGHLQQLQSNPMRKAEFEALHKEWTALAAIADKLEAQVEQEHEAQPPEQQVSDDLQIGMAKVAADHQVKQVKAAGDAQIKVAKFNVDSGIKVRNAAVDNRIKLATSRNGSKPAKAGA